VLDGPTRPRIGLPMRRESSSQVTTGRHALGAESDGGKRDFREFPMNPRGADS